MAFTVENSKEQTLWNTLSIVEPRIFEMIDWIDECMAREDT